MNSIQLQKDKDTERQQQIHHEQNPHLYCILHTDCNLLFAFLSSFLFAGWDDALHPDNVMLFEHVDVLADNCVYMDGCGWMCANNNCTTFVSFIIHFVNQ